MKFQYSLIVNTDKFKVYDSNEKFNLPLGTFDMTMDIDAGPAPTRRGVQDQTWSYGGMELVNDKLDGSGGPDLYGTRVV